MKGEKYEKNKFIINNVIKFLIISWLSKFRSWFIIDSIILASKSPRRRELIDKLGITKYKIIEADIDETMPASMPASEAVQMAALKKAQEVYNDPNDEMGKHISSFVADCVLYGMIIEEEE